MRMTAHTGQMQAGHVSLPVMLVVPLIVMYVLEWGGCP